MNGIRTRIDETQAEPLLKASATDAAINMLVLYFVQCIKKLTLILISP